MTDFEPRALHLHTLDTLLADLIGGRPILVAAGDAFALPSEAARSVLQWYKDYGAARWPANLNPADLEKLVDATQKPAPAVPASRPLGPSRALRKLTLQKLEAHRFAGLHKYGTPAAAPKNFVYDFTAPVTLFEGRNGSGKTSLVNAIIWTLTGELLRPQRFPEKADADYECLIDGVGEVEPTSHKLSPVTPLPDVADFRPDQDWILADTWVELTFADDTGAVLPPVRRSQSRTARGKLTEDSNVHTLGLDPIAMRIGTVMPGLLPLIQVGSESELGRAVSQLTGLSALVDLADHCRRSIARLKDFTKTKKLESDGADQRYNTAKKDIENLLSEHPSIAPPTAVPAPSHDPAIEGVLQAISDHFEGLKTQAYQSAKSILGEEFDPEDSESKSDLDENVALALAELGRIGKLPALSRLRELGTLNDEEKVNARARINTLRGELRELQSLAENPDTAARTRLYARIASWLTDHPDATRDDDQCVACGGSLIGVVDPVTGKTVKWHLDDATKSASLMALTLKQWAQAAVNELTASLPEPLQREMTTSLPGHPTDLLRTALCEELFEASCFGGVLGALQASTSASMDKLLAGRPPVAASNTFDMPAGCEKLGVALNRLEHALNFADWRKTSEAFSKSLFEQVVGKRPKPDESGETLTLTGKLLDLDETVRSAKPLTDALDWCDRLSKAIGNRRAVEKRMAAYAQANDALNEVMQLGELADQQVAALRTTLSTAAADWRQKIYLGAFPTIAHQLVDAPLGRDGELDLLMKAGGVVAPAQHVTNASALRAGLVAFYLAFWHHVMQERGGLRLIILDDPQELLDSENRERLAEAVAALAKGAVQLIVTSYDARFADALIKSFGVANAQHREVLPATRLQPTLRTGPPLVEINVRRIAYEEDVDAEEPARRYVDACRVYMEHKLGDLFEDAAFSTWLKKNPHPTLASFTARLRQEVRAAGAQSMFAAGVFKQFVDHKALVDLSPVLILMNKSHHGARHEIRAGDVAPHVDDLDQITRLTEEMWDECRRWRRRDSNMEELAAPPQDLTPMRPPTLQVVICPDLAAFTTHQPTGGSQEELEPLDPKVFEGKAAFYLRRDNFGFAAPQGSLAIVDTTPTAVKDRRLVIARHGGMIYARRFLRSANSTLIGLTAESIDPKARSPKTIFRQEAEVALHQVSGVIFEHDFTQAPGNDEAVEIDGSKAFTGVEVAFRVVDQSAVPLALPKQVVLGGKLIPLNELNSFKGQLVALSLGGGASIFKRVGDALPGDLSHLRQFESIGGLGHSQILAIGKDHKGFDSIAHARLIVGVLYKA